ncbi:MAG: UDP-N-acetylmuramate--L-alanine ligase, partial [Phocaeicola vulgatus]|nr:UDP-N-acetylmuramate--L-alanine ligase [Phocaeicola vulgatus]
FIGIGGIGMSALARFYNAKGANVAGYDRTRSELCRNLEKEGIEITYDDDSEIVPVAFRDREKTIVVYTPAIPKENKILSFFREGGFEILKRAQLLGRITRQHKGLCVAGTHGKTTTCNMIANILQQTKKGCNAFLGGIALNWNTNLLLSDKTDRVVIEADEFDRSFLHLSPTLAAITSIDEDHLDIYQNKANLTEAFKSFAQLVSPTGVLFLKQGLVLPDIDRALYYGVETDAMCRAENLRVDNGLYIFDYYGRGVEIKNLKLGVPGRLNVENATIAIALALEAGVSLEEIRRALPDFRGVARRFNIHVNNTSVIYIDDYAHHPKEIEATLRSVREIWPNKKVNVIFQPHLYSRTKDFYLDFAHSLSLADNVLLLDIYPARELPIPGVTSQMICDNLTVSGTIKSKEEILSWLEQDFQDDIVITMGAGDIDRLVSRITEILRCKNI